MSVPIVENAKVNGQAKSRCQKISVPNFVFQLETESPSSVRKIVLSL